MTVFYHVVMRRRDEEVGRGVTRLQKEREALEQSVLDMANKTQAMDLWLAENESKIPDGALEGLLLFLHVCHPCISTCLYHVMTMCCICTSSDAFVHPEPSQYLWP